MAKVSGEPDSWENSGGFLGADGKNKGLLGVSVEAFCIEFVKAPLSIKSTKGPTDRKVKGKDRLSKQLLTVVRGRK